MKLSACMIVRDEYYQLGDCLDSIREFVDEIVVVDTGSVDRTAELAKALGARVFHQPWRGDFSFHRNYSIRKARGEWVFIIDADEVLVLNTPVALIRSQLDDLKKQGFRAAAINVVDRRTDFRNGHFYRPEGHRRSGSWQWEYDSIIGSNMVGPRFFRKGHIKYERIVHNKPNFGDKPAVYLENIHLDHYGYDPAKLEKKYKRTVGLLRKQIADRDPHAWFYLAEYEGMANHWPEALDACRRYVALRAELGSEFNGSVFYLGLNAAKFTKDEQAKLFFLLEGLKQYPTNPDLGFMLAEDGATSKNWISLFEGSRIHMDGCKLLANNPAAAGNRFYFTVKPELFNLSYYRLCMASLRIGFNSLHEVLGRIQDPDKYGMPRVLANEIRKELAMNLRDMGIVIDDPVANYIPEFSKELNAGKDFPWQTQ